MVSSSFDSLTSTFSTSAPYCPAIVMNPADQFRPRCQLGIFVVVVVVVLVEFSRQRLIKVVHDEPKKFGHGFE